MYIMYIFHIMYIMYIFHIKLHYECCYYVLNINIPRNKLKYSFSMSEFGVSFSNFFFFLKFEVFIPQACLCIMFSVLAWLIFLLLNGLTGMIVISEVLHTLQLQKKLKMLQARTLLIGSCLCVDWLGRLLHRLYVM